MATKSLALSARDVRRGLYKIVMKILCMYRQTLLHR